MISLELTIIEQEGFSPTEAAEWLACMRELVREGSRPADLLRPYDLPDKFAKDLYNFQPAEGAIE